MKRTHPKLAAALASAALLCTPVLGTLGCAEESDTEEALEEIEDEARDARAEIEDEIDDATR